MKRALRSSIALSLLVLCTASCKDITHVQTGYISDHDDCQSRANYGVSSYSSGGGGMSGKERSSMLTQLFCECMKDHEWSVAGCKYKDKDVAKSTPAPQQQQPTIVVVQAPPAAAVAAAAPEPAPCPAPPKAKKRLKRRVDGTCPSPEEYSQSELDNVLNKE